MRLLRKLAGPAVALAAAFVATSSHAELSGSIWQLAFPSGFASSDEFLVQSLALTPSGTFTASSINYGDDSSQTFNEWLDKGGQNDGASLSGGIGGDSATNFHIHIHGVIDLTAGDHLFSLLSDDGSQLFINGVGVVDNDGPHGPAAASGIFTAPTKGGYVLDLIYSECCGGPAVLGATVDGVAISGAPEPAAWALMIGGFAGAGAALRRSRKALAKA